jgi:hypothetical protein
MEGSFQCCDVWKYTRPDPPGEAARGVQIRRRKERRRKKEKKICR